MLKKKETKKKERNKEEKRNKEELWMVILINPDLKNLFLAEFEKKNF